MEFTRHDDGTVTAKPDPGEVKVDHMSGVLRLEMDISLDALDETSRRDALHTCAAAVADALVEAASPKG